MGHNDGIRYDVWDKICIWDMVRDIRHNMDMRYGIYGMRYGAYYGYGIWYDVWSIIWVCDMV